METPSFGLTVTHLKLRIATPITTTTTTTIIITARRPNAASPTALQLKPCRRWVYAPLAPRAVSLTRARENGHGAAQVVTVRLPAAARLTRAPDLVSAASPTAHRFRISRIRICAHRAQPAP